MLDFHTLFVVTMFILAVAGLLLVFAWRQNPAIMALGLWGSAYLMGSAAMALLSGERPDARHLLAAHDGQRAVDHRARHHVDGGAQLRGPAHAARLDAGGRADLHRRLPVRELHHSLAARMMFTSAASGIYLVLCAVEIWRASDRELVSRWPAIVLLLVNGAMFLGRVPFVHALPYPAGVLPSDPAWFPTGVFELLFFTFCMSVLLVNMAKERAELQQRQHSLLDPLTGIANRRAFFERAKGCCGVRPPRVIRRRSCCSISTVSRRSTTRSATRPATACCRNSAGWRSRCCGRAICSAGSAARNSAA